MEWTPNQVVAYNLRRLRLELDLTQEGAVERVGPFLPAKPWSRVVWSAAERSVAGKRIRQFDADEIVAIATAFDVPVSAFFMPPHPEEEEVEHFKASGAREGLSSKELLGRAAQLDHRTWLHAGELATAIAPEIAEELVRDSRDRLLQADRNRWLEHRVLEVRAILEDMVEKHGLEDVAE